MPKPGISSGCRPAVGETSSKVQTQVWGDKTSFEFEWEASVGVLVEHSHHLLEDYLS